jgi:hypothetical protein
MLKFTVEAGTPKECMLQLISYAEQVLEHDARIDTLTLDDAELENASVEDAFEDLRTQMHDLIDSISKSVD